MCWFEDFLPGGTFPQETETHQGLSGGQLIAVDVVVRGILVCVLLLPVVPVLFLLGTLGYISRRIKCIGAFYWRILKVYFPTGSLLS